MPEICSRCGELTEPPHRITSRAARASWSMPRWRNATPMQRLPSNSRRVAIASVSIRRFCALFGLGQEGLRGRAAEPPLARHLRIADAFLRLAIQVGAEREADLLRGFDEAMRQRQDGAVILDAQRAALAAILRIAALHVVLRLAEERQHVVEAPAAAAHLRPAVEVGRIAAHIQHAVDRARPAEHLAARPVDRAPAGAGAGSAL